MKDDQQSVMEPMFPRLHVKDTTDKGSGPRAPPRNKMALYEQLTIPSKPPKAPNFSSQVGDPFCMPRFDGMNGSSSRIERSVNNSSSRSVVGVRQVGESSSAVGNKSGVRDRRERKTDDDDDFRVPNFDRPGAAMPNEKEVRVVRSTKQTSFSGSNPNKRQFEELNSSGTGISNFKSRNNVASVGEKLCDDTLIIRESGEGSSFDKITDKTITDKVSLRKDAVTKAWKSTRGDSMVAHDSPHKKDVNHDDESSGVVTMGNHLHSKEPSFSKRSPGEGCETANLVNICSQNHNVNMSRENDLVPETTKMKSTSDLEVTIDDAVEVMGLKQFWKARTAIRNQQSVFHKQVFELHRLIMVQKLIAASPHLLLEGNLRSTFSPKTPSSITGSDSNSESQPAAAGQSGNSHKQDQEAEVVAENVSINPPLPNCADRVSHDLEGPVPKSSLPVPPTVLAPDNKTGTWCYNPTTNQWLVPMMLPSEGLVFKPCVGVCPPASGFMSPIYGSYTPHNPTMVAGSYANQMYGAPPSQQPLSIGVLPSGQPVMPNYYHAPYVLPIVNPLISTSASEQASHLNGPQPGGHVDQHSKSFGNVSNARSDAFSSHFCKLHTSKDSELQESTICSPEKVHSKGKDVLPPFHKFQIPKNLASQSQSCDMNKRARVIKVVPHNARSASESAARIFQSIQEERQQLDL